MKHLDELHQLTEAMFHLLQRESQCLLDTSAAETLADISQEKARLASEIEQLAHQDGGCLMQLLGDRPYPLTDVKLSDTLRAVKETLRECKRLNNMNGDRLTAIRSRAERSVKLLLGSAQPQVYAQSGQLNSLSGARPLAKA